MPTQRGNRIIALTEGKSFGIIIAVEVDEALHPRILQGELDLLSAKMEYKAGSRKGETFDLPVRRPSADEACMLLNQYMANGWIRVGFGATPPNNGSPIVRV